MAQFFLPILLNLTCSVCVCGCSCVTYYRDNGTKKMPNVLRKKKENKLEESGERTRFCSKGNESAITTKQRFFK